MASFGKWIGGGIGWALGGPIGALIGFSLGSYFDDASGSRSGTASRGRTQTGGGDFVMALIVLAAAVMKADGKVLKSELDYVNKFFTSQFGAAKAREAMLALREILKQSYSPRQISMQIRQYMDHASRVQLVHFLFGISQADGQVDQSEIDLIRTLAGYLGVSQADFESIKAMFVKETASAYKILEIKKSATNDEIKKAYRRMAIKYHPDKVAHLGGDFQKSAKEKFQALSDAYERIKKERGIN